MTTVTPYIELAMEGALRVLKDFKEELKSEDKASPKLQHILHYCIISIYFMLFYFLQLKLKIIIDVIS